MSLEIGRLGFLPPPAMPRPGAAGGPGAPGDFTRALAGAQGARAVAAPSGAGAVPPTPPPEVIDAVHAAAARAQELHEQNRELHFHKDERTGRVIVQVRDLRGNVIRTIPPSQALDVMSGAAL